MNQLTNTLARYAKSALLGLGLLGTYQGLTAQTIQITSPADGTVISSGRTVTVTVDADFSAFRSITIFTPDRENSSVLSAPPYRFSFSLSSGTPSGPNHSISAMGIPISGGKPVYSSISVDIERPESPRQLIPGLQVISFGYVGERTPLNLTGVFADGSRTGLEDSSYTSYSSDTPSVATVDGGGMVTAVAPGKASLKITYAPPSAKSIAAQASVTVPRPIVVVPKSSSLFASQSEDLGVTLALRPELDQALIWSIDPQVGKIDQDGHYTAPPSVASRRKVIVTATSVADPTKFASAEIWILPRQRGR